MINSDIEELNIIMLIYGAFSGYEISFVSNLKKCIDVNIIMDLFDNRSDVTKQVNNSTGKSKQLSDQNKKVGQIHVILIRRYYRQRREAQIAHT